jgi:outer membrane protein
MRVAWLMIGAASLGFAQGPLQLSIKRAVEMAISPEGNTRVQLTGEALKQAQLKSLETRAALLPDIEGAVSYQSRTQNLAALGLGAGTLSQQLPGFKFPTFVGPFSTLDARVSASQTVFDFGLWQRYQASKVGISAAKQDVDTADEQVAGQVARAYLAAVKASMDVETAQANVTLSEAVQKQAENQKAAGTGTGIEITRAKVQLANDQQHLLTAHNAERATRLQLLRAISLRLDTDVQLTDRMEYTPVDAVTLEQAKAQALELRPDLKAQQDRETNARLSASATKMERLPTVAAFGDYGANGTAINNSLPTRTVGIQIKVPIFDGGRRDARREESASQYRSEKVRTNDLKEQVELDVRLALDELKSADEEVQVAKDGLTLAVDELTQARRRYDAGVAIGVEVTDAQTRLARARDNQTAALYGYNLARLDLAQAMGKIRSLVQ